MGDKQKGSKRMNREVPKEREAGICVPEMGAEERDTPPPERGKERGQDNRGVRGVTEDRELVRGAGKDGALRRGGPQAALKLQLSPRRAPCTVPTPAHVVPLCHQTAERLPSSVTASSQGFLPPPAGAFPVRPASFKGKPALSCSLPLSVPTF